MGKFVKPTPIDKEIILDPKKVIMSKTNAKGIIEYANDYFVKICGYKEYQLMGKPHNVIRHPDMPKIIFKVLWDRLHQGKNIHAVVKNLAKDGRYYWVITNFETKFDDQGNIVSHYSRRKAAPEHVVFGVSRLYKILLSLESNDRTLEKSLKYFENFFEYKNTTYDEFILDLIGTTESKLMTYFTNPELNLNTTDLNNLIKENSFLELKTEVNNSTVIENNTVDDIDENIEIQQENRKSFFERFFF